MMDRRWMQGGGLAGIAAVIISVVTGAVVASTSPPDSSATTAQIVTYINNNQSALLAQQALLVVFAALILWFAGTVARLYLARDERTPLGPIVLAASVGIVVTLSLDSLPVTALVFLSQQGALSDPALTRAFYALQGILVPGALGCIAAVFLVALGAGMLRGVFAARWLGWLCFVLAALDVLAGILGVTRLDGGTLVISFFPVAGSMVVILIASIFLLLDGRAESALAPSRESAAAG